MCPYRGVKAQVANVAGDDLLLLEGLRDAKSVIDHRLLHRVHLKEKPIESGYISIYPFSDPFYPHKG